MDRLTEILTEAEQERLVLLAEECAEVQQAVCKILRHGYESTNPKMKGGETNREMLQREMGDLTHVMDRLIDHGDVDARKIAMHSMRKSAEIGSWLHHQGDRND
jgi:hypothetical protein